MKPKEKMQKFSLPDGDALYACTKRFLNKETRIACITVICCAFLTHLFRFTNDLPNHDAFLGRFSSDDFTTLGRWLNYYVSKLDGRFSAPWLSGALSMLFLCSASVLSIRMLEIKKPIGIVTVGCLMVTCPVVANTLAYWGYPFFIALLLSVAGAYLTDRKRFGWIGGGILMGMSLAVYQAYIFTAIALFGIRYLCLLLSPDTDDRTMLKKLLSYALSLALAAAVYMVGLTVVLSYRGIVLDDYKGISSMLSGEGMVLQSAWDAIGRIYGYFLNPSTWRASGMFHSEIARFAFGLALVTNLGLTVYLMLANGKRSALRYALIALVTLAAPLVFNGMYFIDAANVHTCMVYALVMVFAESAVLYEHTSECINMRGGGGRSFIRNGALALGYVLTVTFAVLGLNWFGYSDHAYAAMQLQFDGQYAMANRIVDRIEQMEEYTPNMPIYFAGNPQNGNYDGQRDDEFSYYANTVAFGYGGDYTYFLHDGYMKKFFANYLGVYYASPDESDARAAMQSDAYGDMPCFPHKDSVKMIDGIVLVKLGESS